MDISFTPWTSVSPNQTASTMAAWEDQFEDSLLITNIAASDFATGLYPVFNVFSYGATGDGTTNDTTAFQAAVDAAEAVGGGIVEVPVPSAFYVIDSTITINEGVLIRGVGPMSETTTNANGTDSVFPAIKWTGSGWDGSTAADIATTTMFWFKSGTTSEYLFGGGMRDLVLYGDTDGAAVGVRASSTVGQVFDLRIRKMGFAGILLDSANGVLQQSCRVNLQYTWGSSTSANEASSDGVRIGGGDYAAGTYDNLSAQNDIWANGLVYNGTLVALYGTDNNRIHRAHGTVQAKTGLTGSSGFSIGFYDDPDGSPVATDSARNNVVHYAVAPFRAESLTYGNQILHLNSEGASAALNFARDNVIESGAKLHWTVVDYQHGDLFQTHRYKMTGELDIPNGAFYVSQGSAAAGAFASIWSGWALDPASAETIAAMVPSPHDWANGTITAVKVWYNAQSSDDAAVWRLITRLETVTDGDNVSTPDDETTTNVTISASNNNELDAVTVTLSTPLDFTRGQSLLVGIRRDAADAADTAASDIVVAGVKLYYVSDGPDFQASTWTPPTPYVT